MKQRHLAIKGISAMVVAVLLFAGLVISSCDGGTQELNMITTTAPKVAITELPGYGYRLTWELDVGVMDYHVFRTQGNHPPQHLGSWNEGVTSHIYHSVHTEDGYLVCYDVVDLDADGSHTLESNTQYEYKVLAVPMHDRAQDYKEWKKTVKTKTILNELCDDFSASLKLDPIEREFIVTVTPPSNPLPIPKNIFNKMGIYVTVYRGDIEDDDEAYIGFVPYEDFTHARELVLDRKYSLTGFGTWWNNAEDKYTVKAEYGWRSDPGNKLFYVDSIGAIDPEDAVTFIGNAIEYEVLFGDNNGGTVLFTYPILPSNAGDMVLNYYSQVDVSPIWPLDNVTYTFERTIDGENDWKPISVMKRSSTVFERLGPDDLVNQYGKFILTDIYDISLPVKELEYEYRVKGTKGPYVDWRPIASTADVQFDIVPGLKVDLVSRKLPVTTGPEEDRHTGEVTYELTPYFGKYFYRGYMEGNERLEVYVLSGEDPLTSYEEGITNTKLIDLLAGEPQFVFDKEEIEEGVVSAPTTKRLTLSGPSEYFAPGATVGSGTTKDRLYLIVLYYDHAGNGKNLGRIGPMTQHPSYGFTPGTDVYPGVGAKNPVLSVAGGTLGYLDLAIIELGSYSSPYPYTIALP